MAALAIFFFAGGQALAEKGDSTTKATWIVNPRIHSAGYFPFTGALLNHNPVFDVNVFYEKKTLGFFLFQSIDLADRHSYVNYFQPGVFATFRVQPNFRLRAFFGYIFSQTQGFRDPDSDYYTAGQFNWVLTKNLRIENTLLFYDFSIDKKLANRLLVEWAPGKFRASFFLWNRVVLDEKFNSTSAALAITFPMISLSKKVNLEFTSSYMGYLSQAKPDYALKDGFLFTLAAPVSIRN